MELIKSYFPELDKDTLAKLGALKPLYEDWNSKVNVISRKNMDVFIINHLLHSLAIVKLNPLDGVKKVLDIGTGGGFPGIPLAIVYPNIEFTLVDSIGKKIKVVNAIAESLGLKNVTGIQERFENITETYDVIVSRAVAKSLSLMNNTQKALSSQTYHLLLKGGDLSDEKLALLTAYPKLKWEEQNIADVFKEEFFETKKLIRIDQ